MVCISLLIYCDHFDHSYHTALSWCWSCSSPADLTMKYLLVLTMYTNSGARRANHDWVPTVESVGAPSYIVVQAYCCQFLQMYSTLACPKLDCVTFLCVPHSHILFSLASVNLQIQQSKVLPFEFVTLGKFPLDTLQFFEDNIHMVILSVKELSKSHKMVVKSEVVTTHGDD